MSQQLKKYVRKLMENVCGEQLSYVTFVSVEGKKKYCCLGKETMFFVDEDRMERTEFPISNLNKIVLDIAAASHLQLQFINVLASQCLWCLSSYITMQHSLIVETPVRISFVEVVSAFWKTDVLLKRRLVAELGIEKDMLPINIPRKEVNLSFLGKAVERYELDQYILYVSEEYGIFDRRNERRSLQNMRLSLFTPFDNPLEFSTLRFMHKQADILATFAISREHELEWMPGDSNFSVATLRNDCEDILRQFVSEYWDEYTMDYSHEYRKTTNLSGDTASWLCWEARVQLEDSYLGIIYCRRNFIPPFAETYQDIIVTLQGNWNYTGGNEITPFLGSVREVADTISANSDHFFYDKLTIQARLDALMCSEDYYEWISTRLKLSPSLLTFSRSFLELLSTKIGCEQRIFPPEVEAELILNLGDGDLFALVEECNKHTPILSDYSSVDEWNMWRDRVARYLAYCVDGGLVTNIDFGFIVEKRKVALEGDEQAIVDLIDNALAYLLHIRAFQDEYEIGKPLTEQLDVLVGRSRVLCNESVAHRLLQIGYFKEALPRLSFATLLAVLLQRDQISNELLSTVAVTASEIVEYLTADEVENLCFIDSLALQLRSRTDHEVILSIGQALLAFSRSEVKEYAPKILGLDIIPNFDVSMRQSSQDLAILFASIISNVSSEEESRLKLLGQGAISSMLRLLGSSDSEALHEQTVTAIVESLWKLARSPQCALEMRSENIFAIIDEILANSRSARVIELVSGFTMTLCSTDVRNKKIAGDIGMIPKLLMLLRENLENDRLIRNIEGLLMVLSTVPANRAIMRKEKLLELIQSEHLIENATGEAQQSFVKRIVANIGSTIRFEVKELKK